MGDRFVTPFTVELQSGAADQDRDGSRRGAGVEHLQPENEAQAKAKAAEEAELLSQLSLLPPPSRIRPKRRARDDKPTALLRAWVRIDVKGESSIVHADKLTLLQQLGIQPRDLRLLESQVANQTSVILCRERAIVINMAFVKTIITVDACYIVSPDSERTIQFMAELRHRLQEPLACSKLGKMGGQAEWAAIAAQTQQLPFELRVLEICLDELASDLDERASQLEAAAYPAVDAMAKLATRPNLDRVRRIKNSLIQLYKTTETFHEALEELLDNDKDMWEMNLGAKAARHVADEQEPLEQTHAQLAPVAEDEVLAAVADDAQPRYSNFQAQNEAGRVMDEALTHRFTSEGEGHHEEGEERDKETQVQRLYEHTAYEHDRQGGEHQRADGEEGSGEDTPRFGRVGYAGAVQQPGTQVQDSAGLAARGAYGSGQPLSPPGLNLSQGEQQLGSFTGGYGMSDPSLAEARREEGGIGSQPAAGVVGTAGRPLVLPPLNTVTSPSVSPFAMAATGLGSPFAASCHEGFGNDREEQAPMAGRQSGEGGAGVAGRGVPQAGIRGGSGEGIATTPPNLHPRYSFSFDGHSGDVGARASPGSRGLLPPLSPYDRPLATLSQNASLARLSRRSLAWLAERHGSSLASSSALSSVYDMEVAEVEMLLEAYFMHINSVHRRLKTLNEYIEDTEEMVYSSLNAKRNRLLAYDLCFIGINTISMTVTAMTGLFTMNLFHGESDKYMYDPNTFIELGCVSLGAYLLFGTLLSYYMHTGVVRFT